MSWEESMIGRTIGNFEVKECIGTGGMGAVFRGEHPTVESQVAIKVLHEAHLTNDAIVGRLEDEARAVNMVGHPGLVRIHDCNTEQGLGLYLTMELLRGQTLLRRFEERGPFPPIFTARLLRQAATALTAAHEAGIIHRDLKPSNVFLVDDPEVQGGLRVKVLDFGVAKLLGDDDPMGARTATGMIIGSPQYMSPEQCLDSKNVDPRTDVFSLGAMGYVLLSGRLPFPGQSVGQVLLAHRRGPAPRLSDGRPDLPEALERCLLHALERERDERLGSMAEMERQLEQVVAEAEASGAAEAEEQMADAPGVTAIQAPDPGQAAPAVGGMVDALPDDQETLILDGELDDLLSGAGGKGIHDQATRVLDQADDGVHDQATKILGQADDGVHDQATMMLGRDVGAVEGETLIDPDAMLMPTSQPAADTPAGELPEDLVEAPEVSHHDEAPAGNMITVIVVVLALAAAGGAAILYLL